uniref:DNA/RNA non-specific endonuclease domain-containing protein n=1 Tax=Timema monikensis TaxID=170555 RepID=A0A7R9EGZ2_9NEOP|nr:unnamed protein product [Timema monikensis]
MRNRKDCQCHRDRGSNPGCFIPATSKLSVFSLKNKRLETGFHGEIYIEQGADFKLRCDDNSITGMDEITSTCVQDSQLFIGRSLKNSDQLTCKDLNKLSWATINCPNIRITSRNRTVIDICFDYVNLITLFSNHSMNHLDLNSTKDNTTKPVFQSADFYFGRLGNKDIENLYKREEQSKTLSSLLGENSVYLPSNSTYLTKGHLTPNADLDSVDRNATYYYVNAVPQWNGVNNVNWNKLETKVRSYVSGQSNSIEVYTGAYGTLIFGNTSGSPVQIFLYSNDADKAIPVPKLIWKVVYDRAAKKAIAFVVSNNPFTTEAEIKTNEICSPELKECQRWLDGFVMNITNGYIYCCNVDEDFTGNVKYLPGIKISIRPSRNKDSNPRGCPSGVKTGSRRLWLAVHLQRPSHTHSSCLRDEDS